MSKENKYPPEWEHINKNLKATFQEYRTQCKLYQLPRPGAPRRQSLQEALPSLPLWGGGGLHLAGAPCEVWPPAGQVTLAQGPAQSAVRLVPAGAAAPPQGTPGIWAPTTSAPAPPTPPSQKRQQMSLGERPYRFSPSN